MTKSLERFRLGLMIALLGSVLMVLGKTTVYPNQENANVPKLTLPTTLELLGWQLRSSTPIQDNQPSFQAGKSYRYLKNGTTIDIEARYLTHTKGDVQDYLQAYKSMSLSRAPLVRQSENIGFYGVFTQGNRSYLSACINSRGQSTFSGVQFARNRNTLDLRPERILPWLVGQSELRDYRCLWVILSTPVEGNPEKTYSVLKTVWFSVYPRLNTLLSPI